MNKEILTKFQKNILQIVETELCKQTRENRVADLDDTLCLLITKDTGIEKHIEDFSEVLKIACDKSFKTHRGSKNARTHKSVPWWTRELTVMRKRTNALCRRFKRTRNNAGLREKRKTILRREIKIRRDDQKGENQIKERVL